MFALASLRQQRPLSTKNSGLDSVDVEATFPTFSWQAFGGGGGYATADNTAIVTCVAAAGPRRVAIAGTGSRLEIWDIEMVEAAAQTSGRAVGDSGGVKPGSGAPRACGIGGASVVGLVHCLASVFQ